MIKALEQEDLERMADAMRSLQDHQWTGLQDILTMQWMEAARSATGTQSSDAARSYECGLAAGLEEFRMVLMDLRFGAWRNWAEIRFRQTTGPEN